MLTSTNDEGNESNKNNFATTIQSLMNHSSQKSKDRLNYNLLPINSNSSKCNFSSLKQRNLLNNPMNKTPKISLNSIKADKRSSFSTTSNQCFVTEMNQTKQKRAIPMMTTNDLNFISETDYFRSIAEHTNYINLKKKIINVDIVIAVLSVCSILFSVIDTDMFINKTKNYLINYMNNNNIVIPNVDYDRLYRKINQRAMTTEENVIRIFNGIFSLSSFALLIVRYYFLNIFKHYDNTLVSNDNIIFSNKKTMAIELIISLIFFFPNFNTVIIGKERGIIYAFALNSIFSILSLFKLYFLYRIIIEVTRWNRRISHAICRNHEIKPNFQFFIKCILRNRPKLSIGIFILAFILIFSLLIRCFEFAAADIIPKPKVKKGMISLEPLWNNLWLIVITITSVGYGDCFPKTFGGRFICLIPFIFGALILTQSIGILYSFIEFKPEEKKAYFKLTKLFNYENNQHKASNVIKAVLYLRRLKMKRNSISNSHNKSEEIIEKCILRIKIKTEIALFKNQHYISRAYSIPFNDLMKTMGNKLYENIVSFSKQLERVSLIENEFKIMKSNQETIQYKLQHISLVQEEIIKNFVQFHNKTHKNELNKPNKNIPKLAIPIIKINTLCEIPKAVSSSRSKRKRNKDEKDNVNRDYQSFTLSKFNNNNNSNDACSQRPLSEKH